MILVYNLSNADVTVSMSACKQKKKIELTLNVLRYKTKKKSTFYGILKAKLHYMRTLSFFHIKNASVFEIIPYIHDTFTHDTFVLNATYFDFN